MSEKLTAKPPVWFWIGSVLGLLWNLYGASLYLMQAYMMDDLKETMTAEQISLLESRPTWLVAAFAIAVWAGVLGCIGLLLGKRWSKIVLLISLLAILADMAYTFGTTNSIEVYGTLQGLVIPLFVIFIGIGLVFFSRLAHKRHWLS